MRSKLFLLSVYNNILYTFRYILFTFDKIQYVLIDCITTDEHGGSYVMVRKKWLFWFISKPIKVKFIYTDYMGYPMRLRKFDIQTENIPFKDIDMVLPNGRTLHHFHARYKIYLALLTFYIDSYYGSTSEITDTDLTKSDLTKLTNVMKHIAYVNTPIKPEYEYDLNTAHTVRDILLRHDMSCERLKFFLDSEINTEVEQHYFEKYYITINTHSSIHLRIERYNVIGNKVAEWVYPDFLSKTHIDTLLILKRLGEYRRKAKHLACFSSDDGCVEFITTK